MTGFGPQGFQKNYPVRQAQYFKNHPDSPWSILADDISSPFNECLKTGVEQGITGLFFVFGIFFMVFSNTISSPVLRATAAAIIIFSCFSYPFDFFVFQVLGVFCLASIATTQKSNAIMNLTCSSLKNIAVKIPAICLIAISCGIILLSSRNYYIDVKNWNRTAYSFSPKSNQKIDELKALHPVFKNNAQFVFNYGSALYDAGRYQEAVILLEKTGKLFSGSETLLLLGDAYERTDTYTQALEVWETASYIKPSLFMPHYKMAKLYDKMGDYERAKQKAGEVLKKEIKIDLPKIDRIKKEMQKLYIRDY